MTESRSAIQNPANHVDQTDRAGFFERIAARATYWTGTTAMFVLAVALVIAWCVVGPYFHFSDTWQLIINTGTSIITFIMVFLIQRSQNREMLSLKIQLGELITSLQEANNTVLDLDHLSERQLAALLRRYQELSHQTVIIPLPPQTAPMVDIR